MGRAQHTCPTGYVPVSQVSNVFGYSYNISVGVAKRATETLQTFVSETGHVYIPQTNVTKFRDLYQAWQVSQKNTPKSALTNRVLETEKNILILRNEMEKLAASVLPSDQYQRWFYNFRLRFKSERETSEQHNVPST